MSQILIVLGLVLVAIGLLWRWLGRLELGRLPGDIVIKHENFIFYFPITTGLVISAVLTLIFWLANRVISGGRGAPPMAPAGPHGGQADIDCQVADSRIKSDCKNITSSPSPHPWAFQTRARAR